MISAILVLSFLIFFHELGHYIGARIVGVKVERFSIGFGKVLLSKKLGGTEWAISLIPLGGYVKLKGQDDLNPLLKVYEKDSYNTKTPLQRIFILFMGPFFNILLAFLFFFFAALIGVKELDTKIGDVFKDGAAYNILKRGDKIIKVNGRKVFSWKELQKITREANGKLIIEFLREGELKRAIIEPKVMEIRNIFKETVKVKLIGVSPYGSFILKKYSFFEAIKYAFFRTYEASKLIIKSIEKMISGAIGTENLGGIISVVKITKDVSKEGLSPLLILAALISVNLGIINLLPIPALDGGHILINLYELIFRKEPNETVVEKITIFGWIILGSLMLFTIYLDLKRFYF